MFSFTFHFEFSDCSDAVKDSLASAMRHTRRHAQETYDKRTATQRKGAALSLAAQFAETNEETGVGTENHSPVANGNRHGLCQGIMLF